RLRARAPPSFPGAGATARASEPDAVTLLRVRQPACYTAASRSARARARVAELVDALDLGSSGATRGGSSPPSRTSRRRSMRLSLNHHFDTFKCGATLMTKVELEAVDAVRRRLAVEIPADDVTAELERAYEQLRRRARVPGFRPGRAPRAVLEKMFGDQVLADVFGKLVQ